MDTAGVQVIVSSPDSPAGRPQAAVSPLPPRPDFVDVDLSSPRPAPDVLDLLPLPTAGDTPLPTVAPAPDLLQPSKAKPSVPGRRSNKMESTNPTSASNLMPPSLTSSGSAVEAPVQPTVMAPTQNTPVPTKDPETDAKIPGDTSKSPPPNMQTSTITPVAPPGDDRRFAGMTEAVARQALLDFARGKCCYSTAPAREMTIQEMQHFRTYRYCLETFTEHRSCEWVTELYTGQAANSSSVRPAPQPWDIPVAVPMLFKDGVQKMVMPQTSSVQACSRCNGLGRNMCLKCHGTGRAQCMWCNGTGRRMQIEVCQHCCGNGTESCRMCQNINQQCVTCGGKGRILTYMQLSVTWKNNEFQFITEQNSEFPAELFKDVKGEKVLTDEKTKVTPITDFPEPAIVRASQNAMEHHRTQFSASCRILRQRHGVERLPLTKVRYCWHGRQLSYFIYGKENKVLVQNYPKKCCCGVM